ncbi:MAG: DegV family protein [Oscillibacter sp.]|nr:DegV family protein [Oscillibacter sp.]
MSPKKIALLTDSCADISPRLAKEKGIFVVPLRILCRDGEYRDGVDITPDEVYCRLREGELPKTSLPSGEDIGSALEEIVKEGYEGVIAFMLSSGLSGTFNVARLIGEECEGKLEVAVFDSLSASLGQGMMVLQLAEDIKAGMSWEELVEHRAPQLVKDTTAHFSVDTLEYLEKGGRIGKVTATAGTLLNIKPILGFSADGQLQSAAKVRGRNQVMDKLVALTVKACGEHKRYNLAVASGGSSSEELEKLRTKLITALPDYDHIWEGEIDCTLSTYIGDGILGAAVQVLD